MNNSTQSKVFTKPASPLQRKANENIYSYSQNFIREFLVKRVRKDGKCLFLSNVYKKYYRQLSVTAM